MFADNTLIKDYKYLSYSLIIIIFPNMIILETQFNRKGIRPPLAFYS